MSAMSGRRGHCGPTRPPLLLHVPSTQPGSSGSAPCPRNRRRCRLPYLRPIVSPSNDAAALPGGADEGAAAGEERRRLLGLKYLVRLGIYNEGFDASTTPDQYQRSLGMDEPES